MCDSSMNPTSALSAEAATLTSHTSNDAASSYYHASLHMERGDAVYGGNNKFSSIDDWLANVEQGELDDIEDGIDARIRYTHVIDKKEEEILGILHVIPKQSHLTKDFDFKGCMLFGLQKDTAFATIFDENEYFESKSAPGPNTPRLEKALWDEGVKRAQHLVTRPNMAEFFVQGEKWPESTEQEFLIGLLTVIERISLKVLKSVWNEDPVQ